METDNQVIVRAVRREFDEADKNLTSALWQARKDVDGFPRPEKDTRKAAVAAIKRIEDAIKAYDQVKGLLDAALSVESKSDVHIVFR